MKSLRLFKNLLFLRKYMSSNGIKIIASWPISIPMLKNNRDIIKLLLFIPISNKAPEKPNPCKRPNPNA